MHYQNFDIFYHEKQDSTEKLQLIMAKCYFLM